jgi:hypothetical protein
MTAPNELVVAAFETVFLHAVETLCEWIDTQPTVFARLLGHVIAMHTPDYMRRQKLVSMLYKLPVCSQFLRQIARGDARYGPVIFYERTRLATSHSAHFLEFLPSDLSLFDGETTVEIRDEDLHSTKFHDILDDRRRTTMNLEDMKNECPQLAKLIRLHTLADLPPGLPGRVHVFVARLRAICQGLQRVKPPAQFQHCRNCECQRLFFAGQGHSNASSSARPDQEYWDLAAGGALVSNSREQFCTASCFKQWKWQLDCSLPRHVELVMDQECRKTGRARVPEALRMAVKRNEAAARHFRILEKEKRAYPALSDDELTRQRARYARMLNIDLGLLYAASIVADSKTLASNKVLPGASDGWRTRAPFYAKALRELSRLYIKLHPEPVSHVVSNLVSHEILLQKLKQRAATLF